MNWMNSLSDSTPIPVYTKQLPDWLKAKLPHLTRKTGASELNAARALYDRGYNDAIEFFVRYLETTYDREYED